MPKNIRSNEQVQAGHRIKDQHIIQEGQKKCYSYEWVPDT